MLGASRFALKKYVYYLCSKSCRKGTHYRKEAEISELFLAAVATLRLPESVLPAVKEALKESRREIAVVGALGWTSAHPATRRTASVG